MRSSLAMLGVLGALFARPALAGERACSPMIVRADAGVLGRWPDLADRVRVAFEGRDDVDACARVALTTEGGGIEARVVLPDGRSAWRSVRRSEDVVPMLEALLVVPQRPAPSPAASSASSASAEASSVPEARAGEAPARPAGAPANLRIELSVLTGARIGDGQTSVGLGAQSFVELSGWLAGFGGRVDRYQGGSEPDGALELSALGGRRFRFDTVSLDLVGGPALALRGASSMQTARAIPGAGGGTVIDQTSGSDTVPRLVLAARASLGARSMLRTFLAVDGEIGPAYAAGVTPLPDGHPEPMPVWTVGLALGATVGTL